MTLDFAQRCAERLVSWITPHAVRVAIAGSIRRRRPQVSDVDLVVIPQWKEEQDMFGTVTGRRNLTRAEVERRAAAEQWRVTANGHELLIVEARGVQVDFYWASEETWGTLLMCRTGSREHNIWLAEVARGRGGKWHPYLGLSLNHQIYRGSEEEIYSALGVPWLDPERSRDLPALLNVHPKTP